MQPTSIALIGAPFTGKTELAVALQERLAGSFRLPEYARAYIETYGAPEHPAEQLYMLDRMSDVERTIPHLYKYVIIDSPVPTYATYGAWMTAHLTTEKSRAYNSTFQRAAVRHANAYDFVYFLPASEVEYTPQNMDAVRTLSPQERSDIGHLLREFCAEHVARYTVLTGDTASRVDRIIQDIATGHD